MPEGGKSGFLVLKDEGVVLGYAEFSSSTREDGLEGQKQLVMTYAEESCYGEVQVFSDTGSGLNENRKGIPEALTYGFREEGFKSCRRLLG